MSTLCRSAPTTTTTASAAPPHHHGIVDNAHVHSSSLVATDMAPPPVTTKPLIYLNATCPFAQKAWIALLEKGVDFEARFEDLSDKSPAMCAAYMAWPGARGGGAGAGNSLALDVCCCQCTNLLHAYHVPSFPFT